MRPTPHNKKTLCRAQPILSALNVFPKLNARNPVYSQEAKVGTEEAKMRKKEGKGGHEGGKMRAQRTRRGELQITFNLIKGAQACNPSGYVT